MRGSAATVQLLLVDSCRSGSLTRRKGGTRLAWCRSGYATGDLDSTLDEMTLDLRAGKSWDLPVVTLMPHVAAGAGLFHQRFDAPGQALSRTSALAHLSAGLTTSVDLTGGLYAAVEATAETYFFRRDSSSEETAPERVTADFAVALAAALGWHL